MKVGFVGLGKLGLPVALAVESKGHKVYGFDIKKEIYEQIKKRKIDYKEKHANDLLKKTNIEIVDIKKLIKLSDIIFVPIQTPHDKKYEGINDIPKTRKDFDYTYLRKGMKMISDELKKIKKKKIVIIISTVLPGTIRKKILPVTNKYTQIGYNPFFIAMGTTIDDFLYPEIILFGSENKFVSQKAKDFYRTLTSSPFFETTIENAELIKVVYNTFISTKIAYINSITELCQRLPNTNIEEVTRALSLSNKRIISSAYLKGGMGDGGGCHPRDNIALRYMSENLGLGYDLFDAIMEAREIQAKNIAERLVSTGLPVVIVGKAYKPHVEYEAGSYSILVGHYVEALGVDVYYDDEYTGDKPPEDLGAAAYLIAHNPEATFLGCLDPDPEKQDKNIFPEGSVIIDPWRKCPPITGCDVVHYGNTRLGQK